MAVSPACHALDPSGTLGPTESHVALTCLFELTASTARVTLRIRHASARRVTTAITARFGTAGLFSSPARFEVSGQVEFIGTL